MNKILLIIKKRKNIFQVLKIKMKKIAKIKVLGQNQQLYNLKPILKVPQ